MITHIEGGRPIGGKGGRLNARHILRITWSAARTYTAAPENRYGEALDRLIFTCATDDRCFSGRELEITLHVGRRTFLSILTNAKGTCARLTWLAKPELPGFAETISAAQAIRHIAS